MEIKTNIVDETIIIAIKGRLDTTTAPQLESEIKNLTISKNIILDFDELEYISSAGLRVILSISKLMKGIGNFKIINVNSDVNEVFEMTGFLDIIDVETK